MTNASLLRTSRNIPSIPSFFNLTLLTLLLLRPLIFVIAAPSSTHLQGAPLSSPHHAEDAASGGQQQRTARAHRSYSRPASSEDWVPSGVRVRTNDRASKMFGGYRIVPKPCKGTSEDEEGVCMFNHQCRHRKGEVLGTCMDGFLFGACCRLPPGVTLPPALPVPPSTRRPSTPRPATRRPTISSSPTPPPHLPAGLLNPGLHTDTVLIYENGTALNDTDIIPLDIFYPPSRLPPRPPSDPSSPSWSKRPAAPSPPVTDPPDLPNAIGHIISMLDAKPPQLNYESPTAFPPARDPPQGSVRPQQTRPPPPTVIVLGPLHPHPDLLAPYTTVPTEPSHIFTTTRRPPVATTEGTKLESVEDDDVGEELGGLEDGTAPGELPSAVSGYDETSSGNTPAEEPPVTTTSTPATMVATMPVEGTTPVFEDPAFDDKVSALVSNIVSSLAVDFHVLQDVVLGQNTTGGAKPLSPSLNLLTTKRPTKPTTTKRPVPTKRPTKKPPAIVAVVDDEVPQNPTSKPSQRPGTRPTRPTKPPPTKPPGAGGAGTRPPKPPNVSRPTRPTRPGTFPTKKPTTARPTKKPTTETLIAEAELPSTSERPKPPKKTTTVEPITTTSTQATLADFITAASSVPTTSAIQRPTTSERPLGDFRNECGVRPLMKKKGRIVGGKGATFGEWPWQVLVRESTWLGLFTKNKCGGVLITTRYVMTAAHCQPGFLASLVAVFGEFDLTSELESRRAITRNVRRVIVHRRYDAATFENDLALLELDSAVSYQQHIVPICMPKDREDFTGRVATVTGWGRLKYGGGVPSVLQEVQVPVMENTVCQEMFRTAGHAKNIIPSFVCAGYANGQKDSCEGDSGGPLMTERDDGRWVLIGTVSHGIKCAAPYLPGVYMRTTFYKPWLQSITGV